MCTTTTAIERLQHYPKGTPACVIIWLPDDVKQQANEKEFDVSDELAAEVLASLKNHHDCNYGITWDHIDAELDNYHDHQGLRVIKGVQ